MVFDFYLDLGLTLELLVLATTSDSDSELPLPSHSYSGSLSLSTTPRSNCSSLDCVSIKDVCSRFCSAIVFGESKVKLRSLRLRNDTSES